MNRAFRRLGYHMNHDGTVKPIVLTGKTTPKTPEPERPKHLSYDEQQEKVRADLAAKEKREAERAAWRAGLRGNPPKEILK